MVDEAHALGVLGPRGFQYSRPVRGRSGEVDIWMGTLSKAVSCGGYIASKGRN
jgi:7-keto-8-aminopelargonate synthetase-like enzyme